MLCKFAAFNQGKFILLLPQIPVNLISKTCQGSGSYSSPYGLVIQFCREMSVRRWFLNKLHKLADIRVVFFTVHFFALQREHQLLD